METVSGETSYFTKKSARGSITFVAKGLRVLNVMVLGVLIYMLIEILQKQAVNLIFDLRQQIVFLFLYLPVFIFILKAIYL